jgi:hypothetical protein
MENGKGTPEKKVAIFPSPDGISQTKLSLAGNKLGAGKSLIFLQCRVKMC